MAARNTGHYRGRIAPTPTGYLHLGHAQTFGQAQRRAQQAGGSLILRNEDIDQARCKQIYVEAMFADLKLAGLKWDEGPDIGGPHAPYNQSERLPYYRNIWQRLLMAGSIYPSPHSRRDVEAALSAPQEDDGSAAEPIFPAELRPDFASLAQWQLLTEPGKVNWRFRVPDGRQIAFCDARCGWKSYLAGQDFGDFLIWRKDGFPSYELAVVADDIAMNITEVVRGEDLLLSTARQLLLYEALATEPPAWYHCPLIRDSSGRRLAKRNDALSIRTILKPG